MELGVAVDGGIVGFGKAEALLAIIVWVLLQSLEATAVRD